MKKNYEKPFLQVQEKMMADVIMGSGFGEEEYFTDDPYDNLDGIIFDN